MTAVVLVLVDVMEFVFVQKGTVVMIALSLLFVMRPAVMSVLLNQKIVSGVQKLHNVKTNILYLFVLVVKTELIHAHLRFSQNLLHKT